MKNIKNTDYADMLMMAMQSAPERIYRTDRTDRTRAKRSNKRQAILDIAARRLGVPCWSTLEHQVREAIESPDATDFTVGENLRILFLDLAGSIKRGEHDQPAEDVERWRKDYPKGGRR